MATTHAPVSTGSRDACTGISTVFTILSILLVSLRVYTRARFVHSVGKDDHAMIVALILAIAYLIIIYVSRALGLGVSGKFLTPAQMEGLIQSTIAVQIIYYLCIFTIKISILFCYLRIAAVKRFERLTKYTIYFLLIFCIICVIATLAQCIPLKKMWDFVGVVEGTCINTTALFYTTSAINILTDVWILALPIHTLLKIQRPAHEKIALVVVFSLGVFSCIASIVRLHSIRIYTESADPFADSVPILLWSMVELNIGIWCASIPALKPLIRRRKGGAGLGESLGSDGYTRSEDVGSELGTKSSVGEIVRT